MAGGINVPLSSTWNSAGVRAARRDLDGFQSRANSTLKKAAAGFAIAGAAAGAFAIKVGVDAVQAAAEDEESVNKLATTLGNLGLAAEDAGVEEFIDDLQFASKFTDTELRPAFDRLVRSTRDVAEAQRLLGISADVATTKGKSVQDVANALGKAYDGNTGALGRLGTGLDQTVIKSGDLKEITGQLADLYQGSAAAALETTAGKLGLVKKGVDELQESFGYGITEGFFASFDDGEDSVDGVTDSLREAQSTVNAFGQTVGSVFGSGVEQLKNFGLGAMKVSDTIADAWALVERLEINADDFWGEISDEEADKKRKQLDADDASREAAMQAFAIEGTPNDPKVQKERRDAALQAASAEGRRIVAARHAGVGGANIGGTTIIIEGGINVTSSNALLQVEKEAKRLAASRGGR